VSWQRIGIAAGLWALAACAAGGRPKGGLEPVAGLSPGAVDRALGPRRVALLVGIDRFADDRWPGLRHARADALEMARIFSDPQLGRFDHVETLAAAEGVRLEQVRAALDGLGRQNTSPADTVVVYFSTHGTLARSPRGELGRFLVTTDTQRGRIRATALPVAALLGWFDGLSSRRKVLILASCHSGAGKSALPAPIAEELDGIKGAFFVRPLEESSQASVVLSACAWGETAREDDELGHDIYTHFLLQAMTGHDQDGDGAVTATEAHAHAMARTYYHTRGRQRPQVESSVLGADPIVFTGERSLTPDPVLFSFLQRFEGMRVLVDGREKGSLPARLVLEPGSHRLTVSDGAGREPLVDEVVHLRPGDRLAVEDLVARRQKNWHVCAFGGYQWFLDDTTRTGMVAPTPLFALSFSRMDFPLDDLECGLDLSLGGGDQGIEVGGLEARQGLLEVAYGIRLLYRFTLGPVVLLAGPRLSGVHVHRNGLGPNNARQEFFNVSPGLVGGVRWHLWDSLSLELEARIHFFSVHTEREQRDLSYLDLFGGLGWSF